jgi:hypothetical protein
MNKELNHHKTWLQKEYEIHRGTPRGHEIAHLLNYVQNASMFLNQYETYLKVLNDGEKELGGRWFWREGRETEEDALNSWGFVEWDDDEGLLPGFGSEEEAIENAGKEHGLNPEEVIPFKVTRKELKEIRGEE